MEGTLFYQSNRLEQLIPLLRENLFEKQQSPFSRRLLIVPGVPLEKWIRLKLAEIEGQSGIAAGFTSHFLNDAIDLLHPRFFEKKSFATGVLLQLAIEQELRLILKEEDNNLLWQPIFSYLKGGCKKLPGLCKQLALLFQRYGIYGGLETPTWKKKPLGWQEALWARLYEKWAVPTEELSGSFLVKPPEDLSLHLFGFSHLSSLHLNFFFRLGERIPVYFYHLSPCQEFWSDIASDHEAKQFFAKRKMSEELRLHWEELLEERHPLLANLGKVGREFAILIEESGVRTLDVYEEPGEKTQLSLLQSEILQLENKKKCSIDCNDQSIQFHVASTLHREVQILHENLVDLIVEKGIEPKDILVMAPDITPYIPFIQSVFTRGILYRMTDVPPLTAYPLFEGLFKLLNLDENRWSAIDLLELFQHPLFSKRRGWNKQDVQKIKQWVQHTHIRWGIDFEHRQSLLKQPMPIDSEGGNGTWMQGIHQLLTALADTPKNKDWVQFTDADLIAEIVLVLRTLQKDLEPVQQREESLKEWSNYLKFLCEKYFSHSPEMESFLSFCDCLENLGSSLSAPFPFSTALNLFKEIILQETTTINGHEVQSVHFCSMLPARAIPAKVIYLLGMNEGAFPRKEKLQSLDLLRLVDKKDYYPSRKDFDKYLFLEAFLSAREYFIVSYLSRNPADQSEIAPSNVIEQLTAALKTKTRIIHPLHSFDPHYFDSSNPFLKNYSQADFGAACAIASGSKMSLKSGLWKESKEIISDKKIILEIEDLIHCIKRPIRHYFRHAFKLYFSNEETPDKEEDFVLPPLLFSEMQKRALKEPYELLTSTLTQKGRWPQGLFQRAAALRLQEQTQLLDRYLIKMGVDKTKLISLKFLPHVESLQKKQDHWELPPYQISYPDKTIQLIGSINGICEQGLLVHEQANSKGTIHAWPLFLILQCLSVDKGVIPHFTSLIFGKEGIKKDICLQNPEVLLRKLVEYYFFCQTTPSFLFPEWVESILKNEEGKLEKLIEKKVEAQAWGGPPFVELQWLERQGRLPSAKEIIEKEKENAEHLYGGLFHRFLA